VPKPATPFQWEPFVDEKTLRRRGRILRQRLQRVDNLELRCARPVAPGPDR
jgi:hypothetical protein